MTRPPRPRTPWSGPNGTGGVYVGRARRRDPARHGVWALWVLVACAVGSTGVAIACLIIASSTVCR